MRMRMTYKIVCLS